MAGFLILCGVGLVGCGGGSGSGSTGSSPTTSSPAAPATSPSGAGSPTAQSSPDAAAAIKHAWETFFDIKTPADVRTTLLENGPAFLSIIKAQEQSPLSQGSSAQVLSVDVTSPTTANVTYNILLNGKPALKNVAAHAVFDNGAWKVSQGSFCNLLTLEGVKTSLC